MGRTVAEDQSPANPVARDYHLRNNRPADSRRNPAFANIRPVLSHRINQELLCEFR
jgi:hypothetical protein